MLTLIRHSQSTFNAWGSQERNCPLTPEGIKICKNLQGTYDLVICSTLRRARQTLEESNLVYPEVLFSELCREIRGGNPVDYYDNEPLVSETPEQIVSRINEFKQLVQELQKKYAKIAVISHSTFLWRLSGRSFHNAEMFIFEIK